MSAMKKTAKKWDVTQYLKTEEDIAGYLNAVAEEGDVHLFAAALGDVARARGMSQVAEDAGLSRDGLYKALCEGGNPTIDTLTKVVGALGLELKLAVA